MRCQANLLKRWMTHVIFSPVGTFSPSIRHAILSQVRLEKMG